MNKLPEGYAKQSLENNMQKICKEITEYTDIINKEAFNSEPVILLGNYREDASIITIQIDNNIVKLIAGSGFRMDDPDGLNKFIKGFTFDCLVKRTLFVSWHHFILNNFRKHNQEKLEKLAVNTIVESVCTSITERFQFLQSREYNRNILKSFKLLKNINSLNI
jgi:hypothetical protein